MSWIGDLWKAGIQTDGDVVTIPNLNKAVGRGNTFYIDGTHGSASNSGRNPRQANLTLTAALAKTTNSNHDTIRLIAETTSVKQATAMDWTNNLTHLIGETGPGVWNQRSRIEQTGTFTPFFKVSGYANSFQNLYLMQGQNALDIVGLDITGERNTFQRVHILPQMATAFDGATSSLVAINASEQTFRDCFIGGDGCILSAGTLLRLGGTSDGGPPRTYFENCTFFMKSDAAAPFFIKVMPGVGTGWGIFKNCTFLNLGTSLTYAIDGTGLNNYKLYFDHSCSFAGVTDIVAAAYVSHVYLGTTNIAAGQIHVTDSDLFNGIACHPRVS
jgi:hypothetical protein